jgi:RNA polymerase sigma-70 factor, ECF subfamily
MLSHLEDETSLVADAQSGDAKAFAALVRQYESHVYHLALNITRNRQDAEDALQDAFLKAYAHLGEFRATRAFPPGSCGLRPTQR